MHLSLLVVRSSCLLPGGWFCDRSYVQSRSDPMCFQVVGFVTVRMSNRDLSLDDGKLVIPRNANIFLPVGLPHMSSAVYKDADQFLPERWLEPDAEYMPGGVSILFSVLSHALMQLTNLHMGEADAGCISNIESIPCSPFTRCDVTVQLAQPNIGTGCCATECVACCCFV